MKIKGKEKKNRQKQWKAISHKTIASIAEEASGSFTTYLLRQRRLNQAGIGM